MGVMVLSWVSGFGFVCVCVLFFPLLVVFVVAISCGGFGGLFNGFWWWLLASGMVGLLGCE